LIGLEVEEVTIMEMVEAVMTMEDSDLMEIKVMVLIFSTHYLQIGEDPNMKNNSKDTSRIKRIKRYLKDLIV
jgi:hypothetical protein